MDRYVKGWRVMGLVLWIDQNVVAADLVERIFKKRELPFYSISGVDDFLYLVDDLAPQVVVLEGQIFQQNKERFLAQYQASPKLQATPFILLAPIEGMGPIKKIIGEISRPFDPFKIPDLIENLISQQ
jgi:hypothetical protein